MRKLDLEEFVDEIYIDSIKNKDTQYIFFLGAGCSKSSGIPLANELAKYWYEELQNQRTKFNKFNKKHKIKDTQSVQYKDYYSELFKKLFPTPLAQQKEIYRITNNQNVRPSSGYYILASLMQNRQFNTIVTSNFDDIIHDALIFNGEKKALTFTPQDSSKFIKRNEAPLIIKLNSNTHKYTTNSKVSKEFKNSMQDLFRNTKVIFIGYKGDDKNIAKILESCNGVDQVYWINSKKPKNVELAKWWKSIDTKTYIKEYDFDKIMNLIKSRFFIEAPDFSTIAKKLQTSYDKAIDQEIRNLELIENKKYLDYFLLGNIYYSQGKYIRAIDSYKRAIQKDATKDEAYYNLGNAYCYRYEDEKAIDSYLKAIHTNPKKAEAHYSLANAYSHKGDYYNAIESYKKALQIDPKKDEVFYNMGNTYNKMREYDKAIDTYKKAIKINPKRDKAYTNMGSTYGKRGKYAKALDAYKKAIEINPNRYEAYINLFETQLIYNLPFAKELEVQYITRFKTNKQVFIEYDMIKILLQISNGKNVDLDRWLHEYKAQSLASWSFDELETWANFKQKSVKMKLLEAIRVFKTKVI